MFFRYLWGLSAFACLAVMSLPAQTLSGSISGTIADSGGSPIPAAQVKLISDSTKSERLAETNPEGVFSFNAVNAGMYSLIATHDGFQPHRTNRIELTPSQNLGVGTIRLKLGQVADSITVSEQTVTVQTASTERSGIITADQIENLTVINRDFSMLIALMPGVVDNPGNETQGFGGSGSFNVLGGRSNGNNISIDGVPTDNSNGGGGNSFISMDSVSAVKIQVSNFQAEFGRKPGAAVQAVTKSGSQAFHGVAYWYKRHEQYNANSFFNNANRINPPRYRYTTAGFNIGGPVKILADKKIFFFISTEQLREARPQGIQQITVPTLAERNGDFSATNRPILDPLNKRTQFPGNIVPPSRINGAGQSYLNLLPAPNFFDAGISKGQYNYRVQESLNIPKHTETARFDYSFTPKTTVWARLNYWWEDIQGWAVPAGNSGWGWLPSRYEDIARSATVAATHFFGKSTILEFTAGTNEWTERGGALDPQRLAALDRTKDGVDIGQFHPESNPLHLVPKATFGGGGLANPISTAYENRFPIRGTETILSLNSTLTRTQGPHISKLGIMFEHWWEAKGPNANFAGTFDFQANTNNPNDANYPFANAILGNFYSYTESSYRPELIGRITGTEWYVQDNWKVARRLTLDLGLRFGWSTPFYSSRRDEAGFVPSLWNPASTVQLIQPVLVNNVRSGMDPVSGAILPAIAIGAVAAGSGNPVNGTVNLRTDPNYPAGLRNNSGIKAAPRIGFAWDPTGRGRTAIRGGVGLFYEIHERDNLTYGFFGNPPLKTDPTIYYGNLDTLLSNTGLIFPSSTSGIDAARPLAHTMNFSFGIQQQIQKMVLDVSYVGAQSRHLVEQRNLNAIPIGTTFTDAAKDPTQKAGTLPTQFLRPYLGYQDILYYSYDGNSNYNSLQLMATRNFSAKRIGYTLAWTWSKAMDYADNETGRISTFISPRVWNYGKAGFDRTHVVKSSWNWELPKASRLWNTRFTRNVLDQWQLTGIGTLMSGAPLGIGLSSPSSTVVSGSPTDGARVLVLHNPILPKDQRTFGRNFDTSAFGVPANGTVGNAPKDVIRGPGIANVDISAFKNIRLPAERYKMQFRSEFYNAPNHTQFSALDTNAQFNGQGVQTNARFGAFTAARAARRLQFALRLTY